MSQDQNQSLNEDSGLKTDTDNLKERSIRGGTVTLVTQAISTCITVASTVILARLLTPQDFGTVAMVLALTGFVSLFRDLGLSGATIQSRSISHDQASTLFWINVGLGVLVMVMIMASAPIVVWFYQKPQLKLVTIGLSFGSFFDSLGTQHAALLNRQMRFKALAYVRLPALLAGFLAAILVALWGGAYWALVANQLVSAACSTAGLWVTSGFRPHRPQRGTAIRQFMFFGANIAAFDLAHYFRDNMDQILVGRVWGAHQLGLYSRALSLLSLPLTNLRYPLGKVAFPAMSQLAENPRRYRSYYLKYSSLLAFVTMPLVAFFFACSENIIRLFLGSQWLGAVELFRILALTGFISSVASLRITVIMSSGQGSRLLRWGLLNTATAIVAYACGLPWGAKGVTIASCVASYLTLHPLLVYAFKGTPVRTSDFYHSVMKPGLASILMCILYMLTIGRVLQASDIGVLAISLPFCIMIYLVIFYLLPGGRQSLIDYWAYLTIFFRRPA